MQPGTNHRVNGTRLWASLMDMARIGATPAGGVRRLALSDVDRAGRERFRQLCAESRLAVRADAMGNLFARRDGADPAALPVLVGSHLDSQPSGGKFDGALGVLAALEIVRTLDDQGIHTRHPVEVVNWTDEEGSRFGHSLMGSGVWAGVYDQGAVERLADETGTTVGSALDAIAARGDHPARAFPADSYFELHIEQGPVLEAEEKLIGVVTGAQAQVWYDLVATGQDSHAGTTPPGARRDALVCAARVVVLVDQLMRGCGEAGRGTVGELRVSPNSRNVVPGEVRFTAEFRHPDESEIVRLDAAFTAEAARIAAACGVRLDVRELFRMPAQPFDPLCVDLVRQAAGRLGYPARDIVSGAGHDAVYVARRVPAAMVFVPCRDGLSHNEAESVEPDQAEAGCQVLFEAVLARAGRA